MSRPSAAGQRLLTPTEELEKYEQAITLVLQEIDHNFSRALSIVTSKILPVLEKYGQHSGDVWDNSKFWKLFFENSANVSLSGYEDVPGEDETTITEGEAGDGRGNGEADEEDHTILTNTDTDGNDADLLSQSTPTSRTETSSFMQTPAGDAYSRPGETRTPGSKTPRPAAQRRNKASQGTPSGKSTPRRTRTPSRGRDGTAADPPPSTPRAQTFGGDADDLTLSTMTPELPTLAPDTARRTPGSRGKQPQQQRNGPVLHPNVLGHSYRVQATPLGGGRSYGAPTTSYRPGSRGKPQTPVRDRTTSFDLDLDSSPMEEAPVLRAGLLPTPGRNKGRRISGADWATQRTQTRVPGVSVLASQTRPKSNDDSHTTDDITLDERTRQTSRQARSSIHRAARESIGAAAGNNSNNTFALARAGAGGGWPMDSDEEDEYDGGFAGMSPPKTMAFNVPTTGPGVGYDGKTGAGGGKGDGNTTGRLFRTPAKEASSRIVEGLLAMAGAQNLSDDEGGLDSPSVVGRAINFEEDTF